MRNATTRRAPAAAHASFQELRQVVGPAFGCPAVGAALCAGVAALVALVACRAGANATAVAFAVGIATVPATLFALWLARRRGSAASDGARRALQAELARGDAARRLVLELSLDRAQSVLTSLREGVMVVDFDGEVVLGNPALRHALSSDSGSPVGRLLWDVLPPELASRARQALADLGAGDNRQIRYTSIPVGARVFDVTAARVRSQQSGQDFGTVFLFVDSTHSHELVRLKDRFLSGVSHELRTPLTNICAYTEILAHLTPDETVEWPDFLHIVHEESLQLSRLVDDLFDYLQLESGEAQFERVELDGTIVVRSEVDAARERAGRGHAALDVQFVVEAPPPAIAVDRLRFHQVCRSLLDNALKFTPSGGTVRVSVGAAEGNFCLRVEDSGPGVPGEDRFAVFDKFSQLRDHLTEKPTGPGLGLASSRLIVSAHGGMIWCEESRFGGAAFVVMLPAAGAATLLPELVEAAT